MVLPILPPCVEVPNFWSVDWRIRISKSLSTGELGEERDARAATGIGYRTFRRALFRGFSHRMLERPAMNLPIRSLLVRVFRG
jgi:hypothetical protein